MKYAPLTTLRSRLAGATIAGALVAGLSIGTASANGVKLINDVIQESSDAEAGFVESRDNIKDIRSRIFWLETGKTIAPVGVAALGASTLFLVPFYPAQVATVLLIAPPVLSELGYTNPAGEMVENGIDATNFPPGGEAFVRLKIFLTSSPP